MGRGKNSAHAVRRPGRGPAADLGILSAPLFNPGQIAGTREVETFLAPAEIRAILERHLHGDFGERCVTAGANRAAVLRGSGPICSAYTIRGREVRVRTEYDGSHTVVHFPHEM